jgi:hypothetical protein
VPASAPARAEPILTPEQRTRLSRMQGDLAWLVHEGYVTEFIDVRLFAAPPMVEARKKEIESTENDPENFPEAPPAAETAAGPDAGVARPEAEPATGAPAGSPGPAVDETPAIEPVVADAPTEPPPP